MQIRSGNFPSITRIVCIAFLLVRFSLLGSQRSGAHPGDQGPACFADLAENVKDSVVNISTTQTVKENPMQPF